MCRNVIATTVFVFLLIKNELSNGLIRSTRFSRACLHFYRITFFETTCQLFYHFLLMVYYLPSQKQTKRDNTVLFHLSVPGHIHSVLFDKEIRPDRQKSRLKTLLL